MKYITIIESFYPSLSKGEKKVAHYVMEEKEQVVYQTLQELSKNIGVGEATILRFCHRIGFEGFQDMKLTIAKENSTIEIERKRNYIDDITINLHKAIRDTKQLLDNDNLEKAIELLRKQERVFLYGVGSSANATIDMQSRLLRYGKVVNVVADSHYQMMTSAVLNDKDLVVAFSISGFTEDIVNSLELAKNNNAKIISITNHIISPVAALADIIITTAGKESPIDGGSLNARVSQLYIVDLLCTGYALGDQEVSNEMREKTAKSIMCKSLEYKKRSKIKDKK